MNTENKLRNKLLKRIQQLSAKQLHEIQSLLNALETGHKSKEETLKLAGAWKDMDDSFFSEMTEKLHENRAQDRQIGEV